MPTTDFQTWLNMATTNLGVVLFALPYYFLHVGVPLTMTMIVLQYFWTKYCSYCLIETTKAMTVQMKEGTDPYLKLMYDNFGVVGARLLDIAYIVALYGAGLSYQISFGFSMAKMPWTVCKGLFSDYRFWTIVFLVIEVPLCLLRSLSSISFASLGSVIVMVLCCIVIIIYGAINYGFSWSNSFLHGDSTFAIGKCFGLLSFGLAVNCLVPSSYVSMKNQKRISPIISLSIIFALSLYVAMGMLGLLTFNKVDKIDVFIMLNIPNNSPFFYTSSAVLCAMLILITPIIVYPSSLTIDAWFTRGCGNASEEALLESEILPESSADASQPIEALSSQPIAASSSQPVAPSQLNEASPSQPVAASSPASEVKIDVKKKVDPAERTGILITDLPGMSARVLPLLIMTVLAYVWPNFGNVVSITGASATSLVNFIFPTLLHLKVFGKQNKWLAVLDVILTAFGVFAAVLGTYMSFF